MPYTSGIAQNRPLGLAATVPWRVVAVRPEADCSLWVTFADGVAGRVHCSGLIHSERAGVFAALRDPARFAQVFVDHGAVAWPGDIDLAPDAIYDAIVADGEWRLPA